LEILLLLFQTIRLWRPVPKRSNPGNLKGNWNAELLRIRV
jgi:hypothetical protein